jgi:hypothetical protein
MKLAPVIFVVGPSGVGKDEVCGWIKTQYNFVHVDIDQPGHFEAKGLQSQWNRLKKLDPSALASALRGSASEANAVGVVISLPSDKVMMPEMGKTAEAVGIFTLVLWGPIEACKRARKGRDGSVKDTYDQKNRKAFATYSLPEFADSRVEVFGADGYHLPRDQIRTLIRDRLARCYESPHFREWTRLEFN